MRLHETISTIEKQTGACLEGCAPSDPFMAMLLLDVDKVKQIMRASAAESFTARVEYYESQFSFSPAVLDDVIDETVDATLSLAPSRFGWGSRYKEAVPIIREELVAELRSILAKWPKSQPTSPAQPAYQTDHQVKKRSRRHWRYIEIDQALQSIWEARPKNHAEVFQFLDERKVPLPSRNPFRDARGWLKGYERAPGRAASWLSQRWGRLGLPPFVPGPKKKFQ
jgi:hypothetical protein